MAPTNAPPTASPTVPKAGALHVWAARATTVSDALAAGATCYGVGDPHYKSFDGSYFDFYGKGQFYLVKSNQLQIQTLLTQLPSNSYVSFHTGVAFAGSAMRGSTLQVLGGAGGLGVSPRPTRDQHAVAMLLVLCYLCTARAGHGDPDSFPLMRPPSLYIRINGSSYTPGQQLPTMSIVPTGSAGSYSKSAAWLVSTAATCFALGGADPVFAPSSFNVVSQPQRR